MRQSREEPEGTVSHAKRTTTKCCSPTKIKILGGKCTRSVRVISWLMKQKGNRKCLSADRMHLFLLLNLALALVMPLPLRYRTFCTSRNLDTRIDGDNGEATQLPWKLVSSGFSHLPRECSKSKLRKNKSPRKGFPLKEGEKSRTGRGLDSPKRRNFVPPTSKSYTYRRIGRMLRQAANYGVHSISAIHDCATVSNSQRYERHVNYCLVCMCEYVVSYSLPKCLSRRQNPKVRSLAA